MNNSTPTSLKPYFMYKAKRLGILALGFVIGGIMVNWLVGAQSDVATLNKGDVMENRAPVTGSPQYVLDQHREDCWTVQESPKAELPGAAVVQFRDGRAEYTTDPKLVHEAFSEALFAIGFDNEPSKKLDVIALCK